MNDDIFSRWSRRKRAVAEEHTETPEPPVEPDPELSEPELLDQLGLPNPDTLQEGDDFAAFMRDNVPQFLRKRALKRLWLSNPALPQTPNPKPQTPTIKKAEPVKIKS